MSNRATRTRRAIGRGKDGGQAPGNQLVDRSVAARGSCAVAERQGQTAARNMLGRLGSFDAVPFFWTEQYDFGLTYVGHAAAFDEVQIDGDLERRDCRISYSRGNRRLPEALIHRDLAGLHAEVAFERGMASTVEDGAGRVTTFGPQPHPQVRARESDAQRSA